MNFIPCLDARTEIVEGLSCSCPDAVPFLDMPVINFVEKKTAGPGKLAFVMLSPESCVLIFLDSGGTCRSIPKVLKLFPTSQQRVASYPGLS